MTKLIRIVNYGLPFGGKNLLIDDYRVKINHTPYILPAVL